MADLNSSPVLWNARPVVNLNRCQAEGVCSHVCTKNVFQIKEITIEQYHQLSFLGKLKTIFNDNRKSFVMHPENCIKCGLCVDSCPEGAIQFKVLDEKRDNV
jgi:NAD-dependent dihydropyrimidine dehydrogenase PreA subunit